MKVVPPPINFYALIAATGSKDGARARFEQLVAQLIHLKHPGVRQVEAHPGDWGIDAFVGELNDEVLVWQSKFFIDGVGENQQAQIREAYVTAAKQAEEGGYKLAAWTLCIPVNMSAPVTKWWDGWKHRQSPATKIGLWDQTKLEALLLSPDASDVKAAYFGAFPTTDPAVLQILGEIKMIKSLLTVHPSRRPGVSQHAHRLASRQPKPFVAAALFECTAAGVTTLGFAVNNSGLIVAPAVLEEATLSAVQMVTGRRYQAKIVETGDILLALEIGASTTGLVPAYRIPSLTEELFAFGRTGARISLQVRGLMPWLYIPGTKPLIKDVILTDSTDTKEFMGGPVLNSAEEVVGIFVASGRTREHRLGFVKSWAPLSTCIDLGRPAPSEASDNRAPG